MQNDKIVITRGELYERVWTTPVRRLAQEFGISDVALSKLCRRRNIPLPPRGYWARQVVGKAPVRPPLPEALPQHDRPVVFLERPRTTARSPAGGAPKPGRKPAPASLPSLHPIADRLRKSLLLCKPGPCGRVHVRQSGLPLVVASPQQASKIAHLVDALVTEARRREIDVIVTSEASGALEFRRGKQTARIFIEEELRPLSSALSGAPLVPSGRLTLQLALSWKQTDDTPDEEVLGSLVSRMDEILR